MRPTLVVIGHGMVGHRFLQEAVERGLHREMRIVVIGEERHAAYDRIHLSSLFDGSTSEELSLVADDFFAEHRIEATLGRRVSHLDLQDQSVMTDAGERISFDELVLATGSSPFVPPIDGRDAPGTFVYRTIDDVEAIADFAAGCRGGAVIGGGLLGLEAANALRLLGLDTHVVEFAPRLMPVQLDDGGANVLRRKIEALGVTVHCAKGAKAVTVDASGVLTGLEFVDGTALRVDMAVFSAGVRPRDELARACGLQIGERGGVVIDDACVTSHPHVIAIGEVACHRGRVYGLAAPGYLMASTAAARLAGDNSAAFTGADLDTKLKLVGVDVASFGDAFASATGAHELVYADPRAGTYSKLVLDANGTRVTGGILVGDTSRYTALANMAKGVIATPTQPESLILPSVEHASVLTPVALPDAAAICSCHNVSKGAICGAIRAGDLGDVAAVQLATKAGTGCGSCVPVLNELLSDELRKAGKPVSTALCQHFSQSRQELFDLLRVQGLTSFRELIERHGTGRGCEICKPAVASMLASWDPGYILDGEQATLQDTNDHVLANLQRDGTYSVVPRVPGGEITPDKLIALGEVAKEFDLYTKITGAQRIDLFGARIDQLPDVWRRLVDAGFESGHAYGKALRTVKSCVGSTWCRYGVQDSVSLAIRIELRYRGLRAPHKLKSAVSGCARECAEAQSKDFGIIATEQGYNLYICGNGGMRPQHAVLFAEDLDEDTLITILDRFLMFYIRTADRLERTATWFNKREGGVAELRAILIDDSLGICADLEADMARHVARYECEWAATLSDPARVARFRPFVNTDEPDDTLVYLRERGQRRPAYPHELLALVGPTDGGRVEP